MNKIELKGLDLTCYHEKMENGLEVFIVPFQKVNSKYATLSTTFNSSIIEFVPKNKTKFKKVPYGVAHFLEHQMFSQTNRENPMKFYSEHGCECNASTSKKKTSYLFSGTQNFEEGLEFLLDYVQDPDITDDTVQKEKGIIEEEVKMYEDKPFSVLYDKMCLNAFHVLPYRYPIGGRVEDVEKTTRDDLMDCYHTFYHPDNMFLVVTGNVNPSEVMDIVRNNQANKSYKALAEEVKMKKYKEPVTVYRELEKVKMDVKIPKICVGIKIDVSKFSLAEQDKISRYLNFAFWTNFGATSQFKEDMMKKGILTRGISYSKEKVENFFFINCIVETTHIDEFLKYFKQQLEKLTITEEEITRMKRVLISDYIFQSDDIYGINSMIIDSYLKYKTVHETTIEEIRNLNQKEFYEYMKQIDMKHQNIVIIEPLRG